MSKYFKLDKDKREIVLDKTKRYNVNIDILDLIIDLKQEIERLNNIINSVIEKLENSDIDLDDKFIWDDRDYSTYELEDLIKILKGDNKE